MEERNIQDKEFSVLEFPLKIEISLLKKTTTNKMSLSITFCKSYYFKKI